MGFRRIKMNRVEWVWRGPKLAEIAAAANVGTATVDRVFNGRGGVRKATRDRILLAYKHLKDAGDAAKPLRIAFLAEAGSSFNDALETAVATYDDPSVSFRFHSVSASDVKPIGFGQTIERFAGSSQGLIVVARENNTINRAIRAATGRGIPVICFTTDLPNSHRTCYVGSDQTTAGAQAALLMGRMLRRDAGDVILVISARYRSQEERELGFRSVLRSEFPNLKIVERVNSDDEAKFCYHSVDRYIEEHGPPLGIYNVSGGNDGVAKALIETGIREKVVFIGHEFDPISRRLLETGGIDFVLGHDIRREIAMTISLIKASLQGRVVERINKTPVLIYTKYNCLD
jgi:LacI family transcriptional regulator